MANVDNPHGFKPETTWWNGGAVPIFHGLAKSAQAGGYGDVLFATAGYVTTTETADKAPVGVLVSNYTSSEANSNPTVLFYPNIDGIVWSGQADGTSAQSFVWKLTDYTGSAHGGTSTSTQEIDTTGSSDNTILVIGVADTTTSVTAANAEWLFQFTRSKFTGKFMSTDGVGI